MKEVKISYQIRHLTHDKIDRKKWDEALSHSDLPLLYASYSYLTGMCKQWDALVLNDYEAVMPLPWNSKWGVHYVYSPYFVIGGGVFGKNLSADLFIEFVKAIPQKFKYVDLNLNESNFFPDEFIQQGIRFQMRTNALLPLHSTAEQIIKKYSSLAKRTVKKGTSAQFVLNDKADAETVVDLFRKHYKDKDPVVKDFDFSDMITVLKTGFKNNTKSYTLRFQDGEICAFYVLMFDDKFVYWLLGGSTQRGKEAGAFYYLTSAIIQSFSNSQRIFRFEGSDHEGIQFFNSQWGSRQIQYPRLLINRLPWPLRLLKR